MVSKLLEGTNSMIVFGLEEIQAMAKAIGQVLPELEQLAFVGDVDGEAVEDLQEVYDDLITSLEGIS